MENYLTYIRDIIGMTKGDHISRCSGIGLETELLETTPPPPEVGGADLPGFQGMGPVRVGNQAHEHHQHDVYGQIVLAAGQAFSSTSRLLCAKGHKWRASASSPRGGGGGGGGGGGVGGGWGGGGGAV